MAWDLDTLNPRTRLWSQLLALCAQVSFASCVYMCVAPPCCRLSLGLPLQGTECQQKVDYIWTDFDTQLMYEIGRGFCFRLFLVWASRACCHIADLSL